MSSWIVGRRGRALPWLVLLLVLIATYLIDRQWRQGQVAAAERAEARAEAGASTIADAIGNVMAERIGSLTAPKLRFTPVEDSVSEATFSAAVDSVTGDLTGLDAISEVGVDGKTNAGPNALLGRPGFDPAADTVVRYPFLRALTTKRPAATVLIERAGLRRVVYFDPIVRGADSAVIGVLAAEIAPPAVFSAALNSLESDSLRNSYYALYGPAGEQVSNIPIPGGWPQVERTVRVADGHWIVRLAYVPPDGTLLGRARVATWITGMALALALFSVLVILRRTVRFQQDEIRRREEAEQEARRAAREARALSAQLEAAHDAAQGLSTSLDPEHVMDFLLGTVAEALDADTASIYTFDDEGEALVGRKRLILRDLGPQLEHLRKEDIREVHVPAAMLPPLAEAVATGEPHVVEDAATPSQVTSSAHGVRGATGWVSIPLKVAGHLMGVALWEVYRPGHRFSSNDVAFARALAAQASAFLRAADLYASLEAVSARATWEASRFGAVLDQMADGVVLADASGRVERYNETARELLGGEPDHREVSEWLNELEISGADGRPLPPAESPIARALRGERVHRFTLRVGSPYGHERVLYATAAPIESDGSGPSGAAMVVRDVTDEQQYAGMLRHTNQELRKQAALLEEVNSRLREATAAKDQFLAIMSHELRTPVNAIMGYTDLLDLEVKGPVNEDQRHMLKRLSETSRHLLRLINEILDLAKVASGQLDLQLEPVVLKEVVEQAVDQVAPLAESKGLELTMRPSATGITAVADRTRLMQIVVNLLSNAVKFTEQGGVQVKWSKNGSGMVELCVKDTGPGIEPDQQERIFDEFYQAEGGLTRSVGGTGLGLAIVRRFAEAMRGGVRVESQPGHGAEFVVELPEA